MRGLVNDGVRFLPRWALWLAFTLAAALLPPGSHAQTKAQRIREADCLACHGQKDLKSESGRSVFVDEGKHKAGAHSLLSCTDCHTDIKEFPHPARMRKVSCATCHGDEAADLPKSAHSVLGADACASCHGSAHNARAAAGLGLRLCASCHADEVKGFLSSVHGQAAKDGDSQGRSCETCHGPVHKILAANDPSSSVAKKNLPDTCASCHSNPAFLAKHQIPFAHPVEAYKLSVHGRAVATGKENAATCSDCHGSHEIYAARDARSKVSHWNVPATCGACHTAIRKIYSESVHGQAVARGATDAPVCTDCHGEHVILAPSEPQSLVNPTRVSSVTCGRCHGDERMDARYNLPADRVPTFADSFHGLASRAGSQTVANCASCHGVHNIFPSSDPRSTVNAANLAHTCGACHPGAGERFAIGAVHVRPETRSEHPAVRAIRHIYWVVIPLTIGFMVLHQLLDFLRKLFLKERVIGPVEAAFRLNPHFRVAHWLTLISFPVLVVTGFALKFPESWWAHPLLLWEGHFALRGTIHRAAAVVLLLSLGYHVVHLIVDRRAAGILHRMALHLKDLHDLHDMLTYNLGLSNKRPVFEEFCYIQKLEYLAFMWGTVVMAVSGFILWFNTIVLRYFPKWVLDASAALHYYEAILATLAILIWHMYSVVFDPDVYPADRVRLRYSQPAVAEAVEELRTEQSDAAMPINAPSGGGPEAIRTKPNEPNGPDGAKPEDGQ
jgi:cytochrome b subunit of formate dehydrogenase